MIRTVVKAGLLAVLITTVSAAANEIRQQTALKDTRVTKHATGTFEVKVTPQNDKTAEGLGRMTIEKQLHGDFEGTSSGQMLTAMTKVEGSAAYVAVERLSGTLQGRQGSFALHHVGIMDRGSQRLTINVVPDSGTDQLSGITGTMTIKITNGKHYYEFDYSLPQAQK